MNYKIIATVIKLPDEGSTVEEQVTVGVHTQQQLARMGQVGIDKVVRNYILRNGWELCGSRLEPTASEVSHA